MPFPSESDWRSDASLAYALLRITFGMNLFMRGVMRIYSGTVKKDDVVHISGQKKAETEEKGKTYHRFERHYGEFRRFIPLPSAVDAEHISAEYKDGVLTVKVPKTEAAKPKKIEVKS